MGVLREACEAKVVSDGAVESFSIVKRSWACDGHQDFAEIVV